MEIKVEKRTCKELSISAELQEKLDSMKELNNAHDTGGNWAE